eukprot:TRINITY_DN1301_c0_g2_i1.p1 TRINITY_DN1301_c0_g2~~TRINITY_DN1301_c0_g2_i1.p1  ORF type:complete len:410 (+),score=41.73 TRINITY_DN1301_c0_g2_i1:201-1430(+)
MALRAKKTSELVGWVNELLCLQYADVSELKNGVAFVQIFHSLYPMSSTLTRVNLDAGSRHQSEHNFKILQQLLQAASVDKEFELDGLLEGNKRIIYHFLFWVREHYEATLQKRGVGSLDYDAAAEREKVRAAKRARRGGGDSVSDTSGSLCSSTTHGSRSSSNYTSSYGARHRATRLDGTRAFPYQAATRSSRKKCVFPAPTAAPFTSSASETRESTSAAPQPVLRPDSIATDGHAVAALPQARRRAMTAAASCAAAAVAVTSCLGAAEAFRRARREGDAPEMPPSGNQPKSPDDAHAGEKKADDTHRTRRRGNVAHRSKRGAKAPQTRQIIEFNDYIPLTGLLPMGFNFIDPASWLGDTLCPLHAVAKWQEDVEEDSCAAPTTPPLSDSDSAVLPFQGLDHADEAEGS